MMTAAEDEYPVGSLCFMRMLDDGKTPRMSVDDQLPCKIIESRLVEDDDVVGGKYFEVGVSVGLLKGDGDSMVWIDGGERTVKGTDIGILHRGPMQEGPKEHQIDVWGMSSLQVGTGQTESEMAATAWKKMTEIAGEIHNIVDLSKLSYFMHGEDKFSVRNAWQAWLITCDDDWFKASQSPSEIALRSMEERKEHKAAEMVKSGLESITPEEVAARAASKRKEMEVSKEGRARLVKLMMRRNTSVLSAMNDREIQQIAQKSTILQVEEGDVLVKQGEVADSMYICIAGELEGVLAYGDGDGVIRKKVLHVTESITFGEESLVQQPSRVTVIAKRSCELGVSSHRQCEFIVQQSPDIVTAAKSVAEGTHRPVLDIIMERNSVMFRELGDNELKFVARHFKIRRVKKDTELFKQGKESDSMYLIVDGFVRHFSTLEPDASGKEHTIETLVQREGTTFEESGMANKDRRRTTAVALAASVIAEITRSDLHSIVSNPKYSNVWPAVAAEVAGWTPYVYVADALMRDSESALFSLVSEEERKRLALGSQRTEFKAGDVLQKYGQVCFSVYVVIEGELEVCSIDKKGNPSRIGVLTRGHSFGEFCVVACAKGQTLVRALTDCMVVDVPMEVCEPLILGRPDVVDDLHDIKLIFRRRHVPVEMQAYNIHEVLEIFKKESAKAAEESKDAAKVFPFYSRWATGETMEIMEASPPLFGSMPALRSRYERSSKILAETTFTKIFVAYDTEWGEKVAWNEVYIKKLSTTVRMRFLQEVETSLALTNTQPTWLRYSLVEDRHGNLKMVHHWEMSQARRTREMEEGFTPRSRPTGESTAHLGMLESEFVSTTGVEGWRTLRPWLGAEKPADWDYDPEDDKFLSAEQIAYQRSRPERIFVAPNIVQCFNYWDDEENDKMVFLTEIIEPMQGKPKKGFTCLGLGNYTPTGHHRREATGTINSSTALTS